MRNRLKNKKNPRSMHCCWAVDGGIDGAVQVKASSMSTLTAYTNCLLQTTAPPMALYPPSMALGYHASLPFLNAHKFHHRTLFLLILILFRRWFRALQLLPNNSSCNFVKYSIKGASPLSH